MSSHSNINKNTLDFCVSENTGANHSFDVISWVARNHLWAPTNFARKTEVYFTEIFKRDENYC